MSQEERLKAFLDDLTKLTHYHGIKIDGCGCCGSPSLENLSPNSIWSQSNEELLDAEKLEYDEKEEEYIIHYCNGGAWFL